MLNKSFFKNLHLGRPLLQLPVHNRSSDHRHGPSCSSKRDAGHRCWMGGAPAASGHAPSRESAASANTPGRPNNYGRLPSAGHVFCRTTHQGNPKSLAQSHLTDLMVPVEVSFSSFATCSSYSHRCQINKRSCILWVCFREERWRGLRHMTLAILWPLAL